MSESSSDSDSSCGWTLLSREGSDVEAVTPIRSPRSCEPGLEPPPRGPEELQEPQARQGETSQDGALFVGGTADLALETGEEKLPEDNMYFGAASDDSDIVTLEPPKAEDTGGRDTGTAEGETHAAGGFDMGSSSSSQYTFRRPEAVFSSERSGDGSSSEEASEDPSPTFRRRRARRKGMSASESEEQLPAGEDPAPPPGPRKRPRSGGLNKCVVLALVIAASMGFGHFYGTIQSERRQQLVLKTPENKAGDTVGPWTWDPQQGLPDVQPLKESLGRCRLLSAAEKMSLETQKQRLAAHSRHLRASLEKGERARGALREAVQQLRGQVRALRDGGPGAGLVLQNQKLRQRLEGAERKAYRFLNERESLLAERDVLRGELERQREVASSLRMEIVQLRAGQQQAEAGSPHEERALAELQGRLGELEQKLTFERQRSDLWERLYIEAKGQNGKADSGKQKRGRGNHRAKSKSKETFFGTVKETFDAMKNSTKEFVRHHKEKIKQAKEAVKENLKKFSESVKSTFRHFKDTTKTIFDAKGNKRYRATKEAMAEKSPPVFRGHAHPSSDQNHLGPPGHSDGKRARGARQTGPRGAAEDQKGRAAGGRLGPCGPSGEVGRLAPGPPSPCSTVVNPFLLAEFKQVIRNYLITELHTFHHWEELNYFIDQCMANSPTKEKMFADFVNDVKDYLTSMKEYQVDSGVFEKLDTQICNHFAGHLHALYGPSRPDKKQRVVYIENSRHRKQEQKHLHPQPYKGEGKRHKCGRTSGRHMAELEIELGQ